MHGAPSLAGVPELIRRLAELNEVGIALSQEKSIDRLLETILVAAKQITRADGGSQHLERLPRPLEPTPAPSPP